MHYASLFSLETLIALIVLAVVFAVVRVVRGKIASTSSAPKTGGQSTDDTTGAPRAAE